MKFQQALFQLKKLLVIVTIIGPFSPLIAIAQQAPSPLGPIPNARQIEWYHREIIAFFHFGMNTFTNDNEGDGTASPQRFNDYAGL